MGHSQMLAPQPSNAIAVIANSSVSTISPFESDSAGVIVNALIVNAL